MKPQSIKCQVEMNQINWNSSVTIARWCRKLIPVILSALKGIQEMSDRQCCLSKIFWNTPPRQRIEPGTRIGQTARYIHSPSLLSWLWLTIEQIIYLILAESSILCLNLDRKQSRTFPRFLCSQGITVNCLRIDNAVPRLIPMNRVKTQ